jgi:hypothetical protein
VNGIRCWGLSSVKGRRAKEKRRSDDVELRKGNGKVGEEGLRNGKSNAVRCNGWITLCIVNHSIIVSIFQPVTLIKSERRKALCRCLYSSPGSHPAILLSATPNLALLLKFSNTREQRPMLY